MRSGHENYQTLFAANDVETGAFTVNGLGAPNDSTTVVSKQLGWTHLDLDILILEGEGTTNQIQFYKCLADTGEARGCSTNTFVAD